MQAQPKRKLTFSAIAGVAATAIYLTVALGGMMAGGADRPEPLESVVLDAEREGKERPAAGSAFEGTAYDIQDKSLEVLDQGVENFQNINWNDVREDGADAWEKLQNAFRGESLESSTTTKDQ